MNSRAVSHDLDHARSWWVARYPAIAPRVRRCAIEDLMAGVARALVDAQTTLDRRADESMKGWEQDGIPPSAMTLRTCRLRFDVSAAITPRSNARERSTVLLAPRRSGASRIVFGFRLRGQTGIAP